MRKSCGTLLLAVGILLLAAALLLISYNTAEESRAEAAVEAVMPALSAAIAAQAAADVPPALDAVAEPPASDAQPSPAAEPVVQIDGEAFLGYLTIDALALSLPVRQTLTEPNLKASLCGQRGCARLCDCGAQLQAAVCRARHACRRGRRPLHRRCRARAHLRRFAGGDAGCRRCHGHDRCELGFDAVHLHLQR